MGNSQSTATHHNRLTKPKTNTNSPSPALPSDSPVSVSSKYADLSAKSRQQIRDTLLSPVDTEHGSTKWPIRDESDDRLRESGLRSRGRASSVVSRSNSKTQSRSNSLACFGSRHGSTIKLAEPYGSKVSLVSNTQTDMDRVARLLQDVERTAGPEDLATRYKVLDSAEDIASSSMDLGLDLRDSVANRARSSLTRPRSLVQIPGVATRNSPVEGNRRTWNSWKPRKSSPGEERKWARSSLPVQRLVAHESAREGPHTPTPRAETPGEMDYTHLGNLKLGTLSIVNGAPSPASSSKSVNPRSRYHGSNDDYFTSADPGSSPLKMKAARKRGHVKSKSAMLPPTAPLSVDSSDSGSAAFGRESRSHEPRATFRNRQAAKESAQQLRISTKEPSIFTHRAYEYAQVYQAYVPQTIHGTITRDVRGDESLKSEETVTFKEEAAQRFPSTIFDAPTTATEASGSTLFSPRSASSIPRKQGAPIDPRPQPRTVDSGYSSGSSVRLSNEEQQGRASPTGPIELSGDSAPEKRNADSHPRRQSAQGPIVRQHTIQTVMSGAFHEFDENNRLPSLDLPDRTIRPSASESLLSPTSPHSIASRASFDNENPISQRRLQRRRTSQLGPPVVQSCQSIPEGDIPGVPDNVRSTFIRRLSSTPGMECLTHTYPSTDHVSTTESVADGISVAPAVVAAPLPELEPEHHLTPPSQRRRRSFSFFRRKSTSASRGAETEGENTSFGVVDLGTIASSLGSSPYDAAMSAPQRKTVTSPTHPHQLGDAVPRAKSMVGMGSEAAADYARMHSKDLAIMKQEMSQNQKSYHNLKADEGDAKASQQRLQSGFQEVPPVPIIDTSKLAGSHCAESCYEVVKQSKQKANSGVGTRTRTRSKGRVISQVVGRFEDGQQNIDWDAHARNWSQRRKSLGEGLRGQASVSEVCASVVRSRSSLQLAGSWGRYSGGLGYDYEHGMGVGGSAGTRQLHSYASQKSLQWKKQYGVDLSDVPIVLQHAA